MKKMNSTELNLQEGVRDMKHVLYAYSGCADGCGNGYTAIADTFSNLTDFLEAFEKYSEIFDMEFMEGEIVTKIDSNNNPINVVEVKCMVYGLEETCHACREKAFLERLKTLEAEEYVDCMIDYELAGLLF